MSLPPAMPRSLIQETMLLPAPPTPITVTFGLAIRMTAAVFSASMKSIPSLLTSMRVLGQKFYITLMNSDSLTVLHANLTRPPGPFLEQVVHQVKLRDHSLS